MNATLAHINHWLQAGLGLIYPNICQICDEERATQGEGYVCRKCWLNVKFIRPPVCERCGLPFDGEVTGNFECANCKDWDLYFRRAYAAVAAKTLVLDVIHRYKYGRQLWFEPFLANLLIREALPVVRAEQWDFIVPVPLHPVKRREREFNQAERLARQLANAAVIPLNTKLLQRTTPTVTQTTLTRRQRATNMHGAFAMRRGIKLNGQKIILVDDVFTTGATTNACARALKRAGAGDICVWTVARGL
jgi:ComF family protein